MLEHLLAEKALTLRGDVLEWVEGMRLTNNLYGCYRFSPSRQFPDAYSSALATFIRDLLDDLIMIGDLERSQWIALLRSFQQPGSGYFFDERLLHGIGDDLFSALELTHACVSALDILGALPLHPLRFLNEFAHAPKLIRWLDERMCAASSGSHLIDRASIECRLIFHIGGLLICACEWGDLNHDILEVLFRWLDASVDPSTGFWGTREGCGLLSSMCGSAYIYSLYFHQSRLVHYPDKVIDSVLLLQRQDGLFGGTPESDFAAAMLLAGMLMRCEYKQIEAEAALRRLQHSILSFGLHNDDGGFCVGRRLRSEHSHFGLKWLSSHPSESNMLSTWLRCGTLALISEVTETPLTRVGWVLREGNEAPTFATWL
ncbi:MAG: hypothetical protein RMK18_04300 [Armatimonadota bacterium]|nr:hypothetical protein [Armatimonadota bacterium]MDW8025071.1 hypothetical protein [Armatimonadota bacterium]